MLAFYSPEGRYDDLYTSNYVTLNVLDELKRLPGTTNVQIFGAKDYAMRIWLKPDRMAQLKLTPADIIAAVNEQNAQFAAGKVGQAPYGGKQDLVYTITTRGRLADAAEFGRIIVRANPDGSSVLLSDVARVELGSADYEFNGRYNGKPATLVGIFLAPGANALEVAKSVKSRVAGLAQRFPEGLTYAVPYDTTRFVEVSIREVVKTLIEAMLLVFLVVYLFLQTWRAAVIPFVAVPVSLIGTFAGLYLLGYSINTLTLFGMVLAIGIVVDDAIVVLENVERIMREEKLRPREAAIKAMREVTGPIVAIVLTLCAVFVPIAFLGGLTGELYRQFAVTISISVVISGLVALTLSPALCVIMLSHSHRPPGRFFRWFNDWFTRVTHRYSDGVIWMIRRGVLGIVLFARDGRDHRGPLADSRRAASSPTRTRASTSPRRSCRTARRSIAPTRWSPKSRRRFTRTRPTSTSCRSRDSTSSAAAFATTSRRSSSRRCRGTIAALRRRSSSASSSAGRWGSRRRSSSRSILRRSSASVRPAATSSTSRTAATAARSGSPKSRRRSLPARTSDPQLGGAQTLWRATVPQISVDVDRDKAKKLGVPIDDLHNALAGMLGTYYVNDFNKYGRTWQVLMSADPQYRMRPDDIGGVYVRSTKGEMIPLASLVKVEYSSGPGRARPLQQPAGGQDHRPGGARIQLGAGDRARRADREGGAAARLLATTGAARRSRKSARAARRASRWCSRWSWCS